MANSLEEAVRTPREADRNIDLDEKPSPPPEASGGNSQAFIDQTVMPRIEGRANRIDCRL